MEISRSRYLRRTTCVKCSERGNAVLNGKDVYCSRCFDDYCAHQFRSAFGRHKILKGRNERVLVAISGGPISAGTLLDLVRRSCDGNAHKRLQIQPEILHVIEPDIYKPTSETTNFSWLISSNTTTLPCHFVHFGAIFNVDPASTIVSGTSHDLESQLHEFPNESKLTKLLESFSSDTSRLDFYRRLKTLLFVLCARKLGIRYVMVGDTCTDLSSRILSSTTQGRGGQTPDDVNVMDTRWCTAFGATATDGVRILRPLREFQNREIAYYNHFRQLYKSVFLFQKPGVLGHSPSLQSASDDFVDALQAQFPATVSTLFASASKLMSFNSVKSNDTNEVINRGQCRLCASAIDLEEPFELSVTPGFCYGCALALSDLTDHKRLPSFLQAS